MSHPMLDQKKIERDAKTFALWYAMYQVVTLCVWLLLDNPLFLKCYLFSVYFSVVLTTIILMGRLMGVSKPVSDSQYGWMWRLFFRGSTVAIIALLLYKQQDFAAEATAFSWVYGVVVGKLIPRK